MRQPGMLLNHLFILLLAELEKWGAGGHHSSQHGFIFSRKGKRNAVAFQLLQLLAFHELISMVFFLVKLLMSCKWASSEALDLFYVLLSVALEWIQQIEGTEAALHQKMMDLEIEMVSH